MRNGNFDNTISELIKIDSVVAEQPISDRLRESSNLLEQEIVLQEKYEMPLQILVKTAKEIKSWWSEFNNKKGNKELIIFPLDFPDDDYLDVSTVLKRIYSTKEIKKINSDNG